MPLHKHKIQNTPHCSNTSFPHSTHVWGMRRIELPSSTTVGEKVWHWFLLKKLCAYGWIFGCTHIITRHHKLGIISTMKFQMLIKQWFYNYRFNILCDFPFCDPSNFTYRLSLKTTVLNWYLHVCNLCLSLLVQFCKCSRFHTFCKLKKKKTFSVKAFGLTRKRSAIFVHLKMTY